MTEYINCEIEGCKEPIYWIVEFGDKRYAVCKKHSKFSKIKRVSAEIPL